MPHNTNAQVSPNQPMGTRRSGSRDPGLRATMGLSHIAFALNMGTRRSGSRDPGIQATWAPGVQEAGTQALPPRLWAHPSGPCRMAQATLSLADPLCGQLRLLVRRTTRDAQRGSTKAYVPPTMGLSHNRKGRTRPWASLKPYQATKLVGRWQLGTGDWGLGTQA